MSDLLSPDGTDPRDRPGGTSKPSGGHAHMLAPQPNCISKGLI